MSQRRYYIVICIFATGCFGSSTTRRLTNDVRQNFTNRFYGKSTGLSSRIHIHGYYRYSFTTGPGKYEQVNNGSDTSFLDMLFYEDGTFIRNVWLPPKNANYEDYFSSVISKGREDIFYKSYDWGVYTMRGDTIIAQYLMHAANFTPWYTGEDWYLIKGRDSLQLILFKSDVNQPVAEGKLRYDSYVKGATLATFHPLNHIPPPYGWLKKENFFWRNEDDWNRYMKDIGQ